METKYQVIPIFPTPLYINELPEQLISDHVKFLDNEKILGEEVNIPTKEFGTRSSNSYLLNKEIYHNLSNYILQHSKHYAENYLAYNYQNYKFSQSWISIKSPNQQHLPHYHFHSLISGVLFYGEFNQETPYISFHREDKYSKNLSGHSTKEDNLGDFSYLSYNINFKPNMLVLFPSYLTHSVSKNLTDIPRKSLAFNVIPKNGFGKEGNLNELKFNN